MATDLGVKLQFTVTTLAGRISLLETGKVDVVLANFSETPARAEVVAFTQEYSVDTERFMVNAKSSFQSIADLQAAPTIKVAMTSGVAYEPLVKEILPNAQVTFYTSDTDTLAALASGQAQAVAMDDFTEGQAAKAEPGTFRILAADLQSFPANIGVSLGDFTWWEWCNNFVADINSSGFNYDEYEKWIGGPAPSFMTPPAGTVVPVGTI
jgi:polar amino acid transport system substrate-binding protein